MDPHSLCMGCMREKGRDPLCSQCGWREGASAESPLQLAPRTILEGKYLLGRVLGQGGFGITYLAWDLNRGGKLAIKEYFPLAISTRSDDGLTLSAISAKNKQDLEYGLRKFAEEGQALARFKDRPGIVSMLDFFYANGTAYIVMVYVEGQTFKQYLEERGGLISFEAALKILALVMNALDEVHSAGMLHRDISPDNIFVEEGGQTKILDFGATRYAMGEQSQSLSVILKPGYAPEEQYRRKGRQGPWTDIYALGATFYRAMTGHPPPEAPDRLAQDELIPPRRLGIKIPPHSEAALVKALAVRCENRFQTVEEFRRAIGVKPELVPAPPILLDTAVSQPKNVSRQQLSKAFFLISIVVGLGIVIITNVRSSDGEYKYPQALAFIYVAIVMMVLLYRLWKAIQDGYARASPAQSIGFLFIPAFNVYWLFQAFWGFSRDFNRFVDRHALAISKLPEGLFLAANVTYTILVFTYWLPGLYQAVGLMNLVLLCLAVSKACDSVNALSACAADLAVESSGKLMPPLPGRRMLLHCVLGEFQGDDLELGSSEIMIGRNPAQVNLVFSSDEISGRHVRVWRDAANLAVWVEDINSTNGTYYRESEGPNREWVRLSGRKLLPAGGRFRLGQNLAEFEVKTA
jgi:serine/threonine protein kinase